jgi:hypothetical protein
MGRSGAVFAQPGGQGVLTPQRRSAITGPGGAGREEGGAPGAEG